MSLQIIKMVIGIVGMILFGVLIVKVLLKPVEDNKLVVLTIGRGEKDENIKSNTPRSMRITSFSGISTKSKTNCEIANEETVEDGNDSTELLLNDENIPVDDTEVIDSDTELLQDEQEINDYTELINSYEDNKYNRNL
ncbi:MULTISPECIES: hypothetical protein [Clostridium]|uniref:hypothetical protein n=1 Tax=Clostridium TaxID=1485 RepID=UPI00189DA8F9|nr:MULTISPECIES: hypothetical protein [Clostridium]MDB2094257.1 hypothetical protein [Clostridium paraputrificum]MDB2118402.1 hypothetical protein [Clostridium paraputrificum]MDU3412246.1 hypothetical protein [Clostridium sp.]